MINKIKQYFIIKKIEGLEDLREEFSKRSVLAVLSLNSKIEIKIFRDSVREINKGIEKLEEKIR